MANTFIAPNELIGASFNSSNVAQAATQAATTQNIVATQKSFNTSIVTGFAASTVPLTTGPSPVTSQAFTFSTAWAKSAVTTISSPRTINATNAALTWNNVNPLTNIGASTGYGSAAYVGTQDVVEFWSNAAVIYLQFIAYTTYFQVYVNGNPLQADQFTTDASGSPYGMEITWTGGSAPRLYRIMGANLLFIKFQIGASDDYWSPAFNRVPLAYIFGDSYTFGNGTANDITVNWANTFCTMMNLDWLADGIGGTGWNSSGTNSAINRINNGMMLRNRTPQVFISLLGYNDQGGNMTTLSANYLACHVAIRTKYPYIPMLTIGPPTPQGGSNNQTNIALVNTTLKALAPQVNAMFADISNVFTSANWATYDSGDHVHPNDLGHGLLGLRAAEIAMAQGFIGQIMYAANNP